MSSQPQSPVTVTISSDGLSSVSPTTLSFDSTNWNANQVVSVSTQQNSVDQGITYVSSLAHQISSLDSVYNNQTLNYSVAIVDDDTAGLNIAESDGNTNVVEGGAGDTFTIQLMSQPTGDVTVGFDTGSQIQSMSPIVFTSANWNIPQVVLVAANDDATYEGNHTGHILVSATGGGYDTVSDVLVNVNIADNDPAPGFTNIAAGYYSACAVRSGALYCWGNNTNGTLGMGDNASRLTPTLVPGFETGVTDVSSNSVTACAVKSGALYCWGENSSSQIGDGTNVTKNTPQAVSGMSSGVTKVSAGPSHSCAIKSGTLYCWGYNGEGGVGVGLNLSPISTPMAVSIPETVVDVATGANHTCAVTQDGKVYCWGDNLFGELGEGARYSLTRTPRHVTSITGATKVSAGFHYTCAIVNSSLKCWGRDEESTLGDGNTDGFSLTPVDAIGMGTDVTEVDGGLRSNACAIQNGATKCWGLALDGALGNGETVGALRPTPNYVIGIGSGATKISQGEMFGCAIQNGHIKCWGQNNGGNLGNGNSSGNASVPVDVVEPPLLMKKKRFY